MTTEQPSTNVPDYNCPDSPNGAHHWMLGPAGQTIDAVCKHCSSSREINPYLMKTGSFYRREVRGKPPTSRD